MDALPAWLLQDGLGPSVSLFLSDVETHEWSAEDLASVAARVDRMVVTWVRRHARWGRGAGRAGRGAMLTNEPKGVHAGYAITAGSDAVWQRCQEPL